MDRSFDALLPGDVRNMSSTHATPYDVAMKVTRLLSPSARERILDVGSGVGKMCVLGALASPATWVGVDRHAPLVGCARRVAYGLGVATRTMFLHGDAFALDWNDFDAIYLFNPFEVPVLDDPTDVDGRSADYRTQIARLHERLCRLRGGVRVVTYNGFGGAMPSTFQLLYHELVAGLGIDLVLWSQRSRLQRLFPRS